jgi:polyphenol oxidase
MQTPLLLRPFDNLLALFTDRHGGCSKNRYTSLNLAFHVGDNADDVLKNHRILAKRLDYTQEKLVHMQQIHSNSVHVIQNENFATPPTCDALITNKTNVPLMVMVADCTPVLFYDDAQKVIAVAHVGRAGAFKNIIRNVIECFENLYASRPEDIIVTTGANIGVCCYEVGKEICEEAKQLQLHYACMQKEGKYYLNITKIIENQLSACGVKKQNRELSSTCTACNYEDYFSYRAEGITGRFAGILMLKK